MKIHYYTVFGNGYVKIVCHSKFTQYYSDVIFLETEHFRLSLLTDRPIKHIL